MNIEVDSNGWIDDQFRAASFTTEKKDNFLQDDMEKPYIKKKVQVIFNINTLILKYQY